MGGFDSKRGSRVVGSEHTQRASTPGKLTLAAMLPTAAASDAPIQRAEMPGIVRGASPASQERLGGVQLLPTAAGGTGSATVQESAQRGIATPASSMPHLSLIQRAFGRHDVSRTKAHSGGEATASASAMGAKAFATGDHVVLGESADLHTVAHEAAHVVQQRGGVQLKGGVGETGDEHERHANEVADAVVQGKSAEALLDRYAGGASSAEAPVAAGVQRYESGEHAKTGDTQAELKKAYAPIQYTVTKDDTLESIAAKFQITVAELTDANPGKVKSIPASKGVKKHEGFAPGEQIAVPQKLNEMARDAIKDPSVKVTVNGVVLDYGTIIAMGGDLFGSTEELAKASPDELKAIAALITEEKQTGKLISTDRWQAATKGRYLGLAAKNEVHFAPSNPDFVAVSGQSTANHKQGWEDNHRKALMSARAGKKDQAWMENAFANHFLTDAFSAGHLFNKRDVMEKFNNQLPTTGQGAKRDFTKKSQSFFDTIAHAAFVGDVDKEFSKYETSETHYLFHPNINSVSRFSALLQGIHLEQPDLLESAVAKGVHDKLNTQPGGVPVENALGNQWPLSGDGTLNAQTLTVIKRAVAQSQQNVIGVFQSPSEPNFAELFKRVWDFTPRPTAEGKKIVTGAISSGSDVNSKDLQTAIVDLIKANYLTIIAELVKLNKLRKA